MNTVPDANPWINVAKNAQVLWVMEKAELSLLLKIGYLTHSPAVANVIISEVTGSISSSDRSGLTPFIDVEVGSPDRRTVSISTCRGTSKDTLGLCCSLSLLSNCVLMASNRNTCISAGVRWEAGGTVRRWQSGHNTCVSTRGWLLLLLLVTPPPVTPTTATKSRQAAAVLLLAMSGRRCWHCCTRRLATAAAQAELKFRRAPDNDSRCHTNLFPWIHHHPDQP